MDSFFLFIYFFCIENRTNGFEDACVGRVSYQSVSVRTLPPATHAVRQNPNIKEHLAVLSFEERGKPLLQQHIPNLRLSRMKRSPSELILRWAPSPSSAFTSLGPMAVSACRRLPLKSSHPGRHYLELSKNGLFYFREECPQGSNTVLTNI